MIAPATRPSVGEEIANSITHGLGTALFLVGGAFLVVIAALRGDAWVVVSCSVFAFTLVLFYTSSTLYHAFRGPRVKRVFRILDHATIYLLIAGTYTPFVLVSIRGPWGWTLFGITWGLAVAGVAFKSLWTGKLPVLSTAIYVLMGWSVVIAAGPLVRAVPRPGVLWLAAGGLFYTFGVVFFALDRKLRYAHAVWHVFVLLGSGCHFLAVLFYVVPPRP